MTVRGHRSAYDQIATLRCERTLVTLLGDLGPWRELYVEHDGPTAYANCLAEPGNDEDYDRLRQAHGLVRPLRRPHGQGRCGRNPCAVAAHRR